MELKLYGRSQHKIIEPGPGEKRKFIQIIFGHGRVGKTTLITQLLNNRRSSYMYISADSVESSGKDELQLRGRRDIV